MKTKLFAALVLAGAVASPAFADSGNYPAADVAAQAGSVTRAQVKADLARLEDGGYQLSVNERNYPAAVPAIARTGGIARAQVKAELARAEAAGYQPGVNERDYPADIRAVADAGTATQVSTAYGPSTSGHVESGRKARVVGLPPIYSGG